MEDMDRGEFFVSMAITDRHAHLSWEVIIVYGPADHARSAEFLAELKNKVERSEELFWQRRGGQKWLLKGDANTAYFQAIPNGRRRKCVIPFLRDGDALLESPEDFWPLADQVSDVENAELTLPFSSEEVGQAIASMKACSAPGPNGLPVVFFQRFWETVRPVIMPMFHEFYIGTLDMGRINYGVIPHPQTSWGCRDLTIQAYYGD
ncbi:hypothetical protein D1007_36198 [Hordeum vulgare]|nr:hypothetical protein D1007_36198 [Hordeum vulgare]